MVLLVVYVLIALGASFLCSIMEAVLLSVTPSFVALQGRSGGGSSSDDDGGASDAGGGIDAGGIDAGGVEGRSRGLAGPTGVAAQDEQAALVRGERLIAQLAGNPVGGHEVI